MFECLIVERHKGTNNLWKVGINLVSIFPIFCIFKKFSERRLCL